jgi:hypothetical protein
VQISRLPAHHPALKPVSERGLKSAVTRRSVHILVNSRANKITTHLSPDEIFNRLLTFGHRQYGEEVESQPSNLATIASQSAIRDSSAARAATTASL